MAQGLDSYVFVSYSRSDKEVMQRVKTCLRDREISIWVDTEGLHTGNQNWEKEIEAAIAGAGAMVVLLSPAAKESKWVRREISFADLHEKGIFPVLVLGDADSSIPLRLIDGQYVDIQNDESAQLEKLCTDLQAYLEAEQRKAQEAGDNAAVEDRPADDSQTGLQGTERSPKEREPVVATADPPAREKKQSSRMLNSLAVMGWLPTILLNLLSLFVNEKLIKLIALGLAVLLIPVTLFWYIRRSPRTEGSGSQTPAPAEADFLLDGYLRLFDTDTSTRIPYPRIRWIEKNASKELVKDQDARELLRLSRRAYFWVAGSTIFAGLMLATTLYLYVTTQFAFNPGAWLFGRSHIEKENPFIEMTKGDGTIVFGTESPDLSSGEQPRNNAMPIDDFFIQNTEVTNRQYRICRQAGVCKFDPAAITGAPRYYEEAAYDNFPVVGINAFQGRQFCTWLGGDLPTTAQWERAARGMNGRPWPWKGNDLIPTPEQANLYPSEKILEATALPAGADPEGVLNLVGNVAEWTRTELVSYDGGDSYLPEDWNGSDKETVLAVRGGSWATQISRVTELQIAIPEVMDEFTGFRCVQEKG